jgi:hypothetical protein
MPLERAVERAFTEEAKRRGAWALKLAVPGVSGFPDRCVLVPGGRIAFVELKRPGAPPRALQLWIHGRLRTLGFRVEVLDRSTAVTPFFDAWLHG